MTFSCDSNFAERELNWPSSGQMSTRPLTTWMEQKLSTPAWLLRAGLRRTLCKRVHIWDHPPKSNSSSSSHNEGQNPVGIEFSLESLPFLPMVPEPPSSNTLCILVMLRVAQRRLGWLGRAANWPLLREGMRGGHGRMLLRLLRSRTYRLQVAHGFLQLLSDPLLGMLM